MRKTPLCRRLGINTIFSVGMVPAATPDLAAAEIVHTLMNEACHVAARLYDM